MRPAPECPRCGGELEQDELDGQATGPLGCPDCQYVAGRGDIVAPAWLRVVPRSDGCALLCQRCARDEAVLLPVALTALLERFERFASLHRQCKEVQP